MTTVNRTATGRLWIKALDGLQYAVALNALFVVVLGPPIAMVTGSLVGLKWFLFLAGLLLFGVGALQLWPAPPGEDGGHGQRADRGAAIGDGSGGFGGRVERLPPIAWYAPAPAERLSGGGRSLLAGALAWLVSFALEAVFGVGVPTVG